MAQRAHVPKYTGENAQYTQAFEQARVAKGSGKLINPNDPSQLPETRVTMSPVNARNSDDRKDAHPARKDPARRDDSTTSKSQRDLPHQKRSRVPNAGSQPQLGKTIGRAGTYPQSSAGRAGPKSPLSERPGIGRSHGERSDDVVVPPFPQSDVSPADGEKYTDIFNIVAQKKIDPNTPNAQLPMNHQKKSSAENKKGCGCMGWLFK